MSSFIVQSNACAECQRSGDEIKDKCLHRPGYLQKLKELLRTKSLRPLALLFFSMCVIQSSGNAAIRPFLVQIFETFRIPMASDRGSVSYLYYIYILNKCISAFLLLLHFTDSDGTI